MKEQAEENQKSMAYSATVTATDGTQDVTVTVTDVDDTSTCIHLRCQL